MSKYLMLVIAALSVALAGAGYALKLSYAANGAMKAEIRTLQGERKQAQQALKREQAVSARRRKEIAAQAREQAALRQQIEAALASNPTWASQPVPQEVQRALDQP